MSQAALPTLHGNDRGVRPDDFQIKRILQAKTDTVVHLRRSVSPVLNTHNQQRFLCY